MGKVALGMVAQSDERFWEDVVGGEIYLSYVLKTRLHIVLCTFKL